MKTKFARFFTAVIPFLGALALLATAVHADDLADNLAKWKRMRPAHYQYEYGQSCFCPYAIWLVEAEGETVTQAKPLIFSSRPPTPPLNEFSIDSVFGYVKRLRASGPDKLEVKYDSTYGFPSSIAVDPKQNVSDDERSTGIGNFKILPTASLAGPVGSGVAVGRFRERDSREFDLRGRVQVSGQLR